ncbi:MAG: hypothetical protein FJ109_16670, partial [Deltaproteobacteria bacterium]|nr:hypothetical protein [Deltaproteobacteria bacterium]
GADADCTNPDSCLKGKCNKVAGTCSFDPIPGCCHNDAECDDGDDKCTDDKCIDSKCKYTNTGAEGCCEEFTWKQSFDAGDDGGFTFVNSMDMGIGIPGFDFAIGWKVAGDCGFVSSPAALYYGMTEGMFGACMYTINLGIPLPLPNNGTATSKTMTLPATQTYTLTFKVQADIAAGNASDALDLNVMVGNTPTTVWTKADLKNGTGPNWEDVSVDLSEFAGKTISLQFSFDTLDGESSAGVGVLVDDMSLTADCNP